MWIVCDLEDDYDRSFHVKRVIQREKWDIKDFRLRDYLKQVLWDRVIQRVYMIELVLNMLYTSVMHEAAGRPLKLMKRHCKHLKPYREHLYLYHSIQKKQQ